MRSQPYSGREKIGVANGGREKWNKGPFLVFRALVLWPYALPPIVLYRVPPFVCIPHSMTPLASSHARTKCARPSKQWVWARDVLISVDSDRSRLSPVAVPPRTASAARGTPRTEGGSALR